MPTTYPCTFTVPPGTTGGKLSGGFPNGERPTLQNGDSINVSVSFTAGDSTAPNGLLQGIFVFSAAADALSNQATPSPFVFVVAELRLRQWYPGRWYCAGNEPRLQFR